MMDLDEAAAAVAAAPPQHAFPELRADLAQRHAAAPQRALLAVHAMNLIEEGIAQLARLGHYFHLTEHSAPQGDEFPRMLHRPDGTNRIVENQQEMDVALAEGWQMEPGPAEPSPTEEISVSTRRRASASSSTTSVTSAVEDC